MSRKRATTRKRVTVSLDEGLHIKGTKVAKSKRQSFSRYLELLIEESSAKQAA